MHQKTKLDIVAAKTTVALNPISTVNSAECEAALKGSTATARQIQGTERNGNLQLGTNRTRSAAVLRSGEAIKECV